MKQYFARFLLLALLLSACRVQPGSEGALRGRILFWHGLDEEEAAVWVQTYCWDLPPGPASWRMLT